MEEAEAQQDREAATADVDDSSPFSDGVTIGLVVTILGTLGVMAAYGEIFPDAMVFVVVFAGLAVWAARSRSTRVRWTIAGLLAVFVGINLVFAIPDLSHPDSPAPFIATAIVIVGGVTTLVLAALAARSKPQSGRRVWTVAGVALVIVAAGSLIAAAGVEDDAGQPGDTAITAADIEFPDEVVVASASEAALISNDDLVRHTFVVEDQVAAVELPAGSQVRVELDLDAGEYRYYCDVNGHEDMEGTLVVE